MSKNTKLYLNENDLAKALKQEDALAQRCFYERYSGKMLAICNRYIADKMTAEDIMVEGMMKVFDKIHQFDFKGSFEGWAKRIFVTESLIYLRKNKLTFVNIEESNAGITNEDTNLEENEILTLVKNLPTGFRTVFNLYVIEGYSHAEIGKLLNISEGTSKSQLSRARAILQTQLKQFN